MSVDNLYKLRPMSGVLPPWWRRPAFSVMWWPYQRWPMFERFIDGKHEATIYKWVLRLGSLHVWRYLWRKYSPWDPRLQEAVPCVECGKVPGESVDRYTLVEVTAEWVDCMIGYRKKETGPLCKKCFDAMSGGSGESTSEK